MTDRYVERTTVTQDVVEALIEEQLIPRPEQAGARLSALLEDHALTRYCVVYRDGEGAQYEICGLGRERINGVSFADACFGRAVVGGTLPKGCGRLP